MADPADPPADETPLQRALRLKKAAQQSKSKSPVTGHGAERAAAAKSSAKSKPWLSR